MEILLTIVAICFVVVILVLGVIFGVFLFVKFVSEFMPPWMKEK